MIRLQLPKSLEPSWKPVLERQVDLALTPLRASFRGGHARLSLVQAGEHRTCGYRCEVLVNGLHGETFEADAQHTDGLVAIMDATARARRAIARRRRQTVAAVR